MKQFLRNRQTKIIALALTLVVLVLILVTVLFKPVTPEDEVYQHVMEMVSAGEDHDLDGVMRGFAPSVVFSAGASARNLSRDELAGLGEGFLDEHPYINIRPQGSDIVLGTAGKQAVVDFDYHWTVSSSLMPNVRGRSEDLYDDKRPQKARIVLEKQGESWKVTELYLGLEK